MAGDMLLGAAGAWSTSSGIFYWTVDRLAELATDPALAGRLREVSEHNLGWVDLEELDDGQRADFLRAVAELPALAQRDLPDSSGRDAVLAQLAELARMAAACR